MSKKEKVPTRDDRPRVQIDLEKNQRTFLIEHLPWGTQNAFFRMFAAKAITLIRRDPAAMAKIISGSYDITLRETL